jgi:hypothetical protein
MKATIHFTEEHAYLLSDEEIKIGDWFIKQK